MKIYCIILDTTPEEHKLRDFFDKKNFERCDQISNCFTTTSVISLLTGKLPSELLKDGLGGYLWQSYVKGGRIIWPFENQYISNTLYENGWDIEFHIPEFTLRDTSIPLTVTSNQNYKWTTVENETIERSLLLKGKIAEEHFKKEREYVNKTQQLTHKNQFYLFHYHYYHAALIHGHSVDSAIEEQLKILNVWDFNEPNALFWIFQDHGNFHNFDYTCSPAGFHTWIRIKDNTENPLKINSHYVSINDFYSTILSKLKIEYNNPSESISLEKDQNKDRIYFVEDSRVSTDKYKSTTAVACEFKEWRGNRPSILNAVSYYKLKNRYYAFVKNLETKQIVTKDSIDIHLKERLNKKFSWIR